MGTTRLTGDAIRSSLSRQRTRARHWRYTYIASVLYDPFMKRMQLLIDEELDEALERQARAEGTSKADLIRRFVRMHVETLEPLENDPLRTMAGADDFEPAPIDEVVYR